MVYVKYIPKDNDNDNYKENQNCTQRENNSLTTLKFA